MPNAIYMSNPDPISVCLTLAGCTANVAALEVPRVCDIAVRYFHLV